MAKPGSGATLDTGHALAASLVACWPMIEGTGTAVADHTGNGHDLTLDAVASSWTTDGGDLVISKTDNTNRGSTLGTNLTLTPSTKSFSIAWRGKQTVDDGAGVIMGDNSSTTPIVNMSGSSNRMRYVTSAGASLFVKDLFTTTEDHVLTWDQATGNLRYYVNGSENVTSPLSRSGAASIVFNSVLGGHSGSGNLVGLLHYLYVWEDRVLSGAEATTLSSDPYDMFTGGATDSVSLVCSRIVQRDSTDGPLAVSGVYVGATADAVQVKVFLESDDSTVVDWADVDASLSGGTWSGSVTVPVGGPYYAQSRTVDSGDSELAVSASSETFIVGEVFVAMGQSNADGHGDNPQSYTGGAVAWLQRDSGVIDETLNDPCGDSDPDPGSVWPLLLSLVSAHIGSSIPVCLIMQTRGGTGLYGMVWEYPSGVEWIDADDMIQSLNLNGIKAALWWQGEKDTDSLVSEANYQSAEQALAVSGVGSWPGSPPFISIMTGQYDGVAAANIDNIRKAKITNWNAGYTYAGMCPYDVDLLTGSDGLHFASDTHLTTAAARLWPGLEAAIYGGTDGRGPRVSAATWSGSTITLTVDKALAVDTSYTTSAWAVNDIGGPATVSAVTYVDSTHVEITVSAPLTSDVTVTFASGDSGIVAALPKGASITLPATINGVSTIQQPLEPLYAYPVSEFTESSSNLLLLGVG